MVTIISNIFKRSRKRIFIRTNRSAALGYAMPINCFKFKIAIDCIINLDVDFYGILFGLFFIFWMKLGICVFHSFRSNFSTFCIGQFPPLNFKIIFWSIYELISLWNPTTRWNVQLESWAVEMNKQVLLSLIVPGLAKLSSNKRKWKTKWQTRVRTSTKQQFKSWIWAKKKWLNKFCWFYCLDWRIERGWFFREIYNSETKKRNEIGGVSMSVFNEALHIRIYIAMIAKKAAARLAFVRTFISYVINYQR